MRRGAGDEDQQGLDWDPGDHPYRPRMDGGERNADGEGGGLEEEELEGSLRPQRFEDFIGQRRVVENLRIAIQAALNRGEVLEHVLLSGMPGLGKTTLARLLARDLGTNCQVTSGPVIERGKDLLGHITRLERGDVLFIDEVHRMSRDAEEYLYCAMEDFKVDIRLDSGADSRSCRLPVAPFTLVGATTREGLLTAPFRGRFGILEKLEPYSVADLAEIVRRSATILGARISSAAARRIAQRSRGTPRFANRFLRRIRDLAQIACGDGEVGIEVDTVEEGLRRLGVDTNGLDQVDRQIIRLLIASGDQPVGIKTIAISVGEDERTIEDVYEPYLIQQGYLIKTPRGRLATQRASEVLGVLSPPPEAGAS